MEATSDAMRSLYTRFVVAERPQGALGAVADLLADGALSHDAFQAIVDEYGVAESQAFRDGLLDLLLHALRAALLDHSLTGDEVALVRQLAVTFRVQEGELYERRHAEVAALLQAEMHRLLADERIDCIEAAYQDALQRLFGLGYDQYLELIRSAVTPLVERAIAEVTADGIVTAEERVQFERRITALRTVYPLSPAQRQALGLP